MKNLASAVALLALACAAWSQDAPKSVSLESRGEDVRGVLHDIFVQQGRNYVLDVMPETPLFLLLKELEFEEALMIVCKTAGLQYEEQNGIFYVSLVAKPSTPDSSKKPEAKPSVQKAAERPKGILAGSVFAKRVTTNFTKTPIKEVYAELGRQVGAEIELDPSVPSYRLDAVLMDMSFKHALDSIGERAGLAYKLTNHRSILIYVPKPDESAQVKVVDENSK